MKTPLFTTPYKIARKLYAVVNPGSSAFGRNWKMFPVKRHSNELIYRALVSDKPVMIARLGYNEVSCMVNYLGVTFPEKFKNRINYIKGKSPAWWWQDWMMNQMCDVAGFFPKKTENFGRFSELMISELPEVDILGSWLKEEDFFREKLKLSRKVMLEDLEPFFVENPWTRALAGKKVLVVHPFASSIQSQYKKRDLLFDNGLLPKFDLATIKAVQSYANEETSFSDWFEALEYMKKEIERADFDICILGCGAYGFPLAAHVKRLGKKAVHLGGVTQLLFGIKGKRWEEYIVYPYANLYNNHWVRPGENEKPKQADIIEDACYW